MRGTIVLTIALQVARQWFHRQPLPLLFHLPQLRVGRLRLYHLNRLLVGHPPTCRELHPHLHLPEGDQLPGSRMTMSMTPLGIQDPLHLPTAFPLQNLHQEKRICTHRRRQDPLRPRSCPFLKSVLLHHHRHPVKLHLRNLPEFHPDSLWMLTVDPLPQGDPPIFLECLWIQGLWRMMLIWAEIPSGGHSPELSHHLSKVERTYCVRPKNQPPQHKMANPAL